MAASARQRKRAPRKRSGPKQRRWLGRLFPYLFLFACIGLAIVAVYAAYLDGAVRAKFEGTRWKLPAKVYASPAQLYAGADESRDDLIAQLKRQGYRRSASLASSGTFAVSADRLAIHVRAFRFWDGARPARRIALDFNDGRVASLKATDGQGSLSLIRLDPPLIGSIYPNKGADRILVKLSELPPMLPAGLITVEDRSFMQNWGVSPKGIARAAWADLKAGAIVEGGSTITQQLVKNFYLSNEQTFARKAKEALMAILLDAHYSKPDILEAYINEVYLGQDGSHAIRGFGLASYFYFNKPASELQPAEIALLIAMVKGPNYYDPRDHPKRARQRRNLVLNMFHKAGFLDDAAWQQAKRAPLGVSSTGSRRTTRYPFFIDLVQRQLQGQYDQEALTEQGLRIFTTLDPAIQRQTEKQVAQQLDRIEKDRDIKANSLESAAVVTSVEGGRVLALVGARHSGYAGFNRALNAHRSVGSLIKPVTYLTAMKRPASYSVITPLDDSPLAVKQKNGKIWRPNNYSKQSHGTAVPLYYALEHSYNLASARLALRLGIPQVIKTLNQLGYPGKPMALPSVALGAVSMSPFQVAQIYNTIASGGYYKKLTAIRDVTTRSGEPLSSHTLKIEQVIGAAPIYLTQWMMQRVAHYGTGSSMYRVLPRGLNAAGKTGTTNGLRDSWFAGFTGNRVAAVWVGRDDNKSAHLTGATGALQIWSRVMANADPRSLHNTPPAQIVTLPLAMTFRASSANATNYYAGGSAEPSRCTALTEVPFVRDFVPRGVNACESDILAADRKHVPQNTKTATRRRSNRSGVERSSGESDEDQESWLERIF